MTEAVLLPPLVPAEFRPAEMAEAWPVACGMLARVQQLSESVVECIGNRDDFDDQKLFEIVECRRFAGRLTASGKAAPEAAGTATEA